MRILRAVIGNLILLGDLIFFLLHTFVRVSGSPDQYSKDLWGFTVPTPPDWIGMIPYLGWPIECIYQLFSLHGIVGIVILYAVGVLGLMIKGKSEELPKKQI